MIEPNKVKLSVSRQCELLEISRSAYYYKSHSEDEHDFEIKKMIDDLFLKHPFKGSRTITDDLRRAGFEIGRHKVRRLMREMGLQAIYPKKYFTAKNIEHKVYPYLLRDMDFNKVDQVWVSDITYIPLRHGNA